MPRSRYQRGSLERTDTRPKQWKAHWYVYEVQADGSEVRRHRSQVLGECQRLSKGEAQEKLDALIRQSTQVAPTIGAQMTLADFVAQVYLPSQKPYWSSNTRVNTESIIRRHILPTFGDVPIGEIRKVDIVKAVDALKQAGYGWATISQVKVRLHAIFEEAAANNVLDKLHRNPAAGVKNPIAKSRQPKATLTIAEVRHALLTITGRTHTFFALLLICGLRPGEVLALRWDDIEGLSLRVDEATDTEGVKTTKTDQVRIVPLTAELAAELQQRKAETIFTGPEDFIFGNATGRLLPRTTAQEHYMLPAREATGIPHLDFRICRRTFATLLSDYAKVNDIQHILGHSTPQTTTQEYIQPVQESQRAAQRALVDAIRKAN